MKSTEYQSLMRREILQVPQAVAEQNEYLPKEIAKVVEELWRLKPKFILGLARESQANVNAFLTYLLIKNQGLLAFPISPSILSLYESKIQVNQTLAVCMCKDGNPSDITDSVKILKEQGCKTIGFSNYSDSVLSQICQNHFVVNGKQNSSISVKTFICQLAAIIWLVALWEGNSAIRNNAMHLPDYLDQANELNWDEAIPELAIAKTIAVVGRGVSLPIAHEIALKLRKLCKLNAHSISSGEIAAESQQAISKQTLVIMIATEDQSQKQQLQIAQNLKDYGCKVIIIAPPNIKERHLSCINHPDPIPQAVGIIQSAHLLLEKLSRHMQLDPDRKEDFYSIV